MHHHALGLLSTFLIKNTQTHKDTERERKKRDNILPTSSKLQSCYKEIRGDRVCKSRGETFCMLLEFWSRSDGNRFDGKSVFVAPEKLLRSLIIIIIRDCPRYLAGSAAYT
jgi:hypothetical protein